MTKHYERSQDYPRFRAMLVKYHGPTNHRGSQVSITDLYEKMRHAQQNDAEYCSGPRKTKTRISLSYDYEIGNPLEQALTWLKANDWKPVSFCETLDGSIIHCDSWDTDYKILGGVHDDNV
jgi:hypothetical protein